MFLLGPLVLWWDGGGKGEKFIQLIKPLIRRGIREDQSKFFIHLLDRAHKSRFLQLLEQQLFGLDPTTSAEKSDNPWVALLDVL